jgi:hypothetical protein
MLRVPEKALDRRTVAAYCRRDNLDARWVNHFLILRFFCERENGDDWDDGDGWMSSLITLRADLMRGDMRSLYLGWLLCAQDEAFDEEELEPPVPPGLGKLTPPLESLASFLGSRRLAKCSTQQLLRVTFTSHSQAFVSQEDVELRLEEAERVGHGFTNPKTDVVPKCS